MEHVIVRIKIKTFSEVSEGVNTLLIIQYVREVFKFIIVKLGYNPSRLSEYLSHSV